MKKLLKLLLLPALCAFFLLLALQLAAQSKDNDVLVMEFGNLNTTKVTNYSIHIFWPDKEIESIDVGGIVGNVKDEEILAIKAKVYKKINELADLGWELELVDNSLGTPAVPGFLRVGGITYFFKRATPK